MFDEGITNIWPEQPRAVDPKQLEIKFFWPLTEQIELPLDFEGCDTRQNYTYGGICSPLSTTGYVFAHNSGITTASVIAGNLTLDVGTTTIKMEGKPPLYRRILYKLLGLKWESK